MIEKFMRAPYREGARGPIAFDCWGLCRVIRHDLFGLPWLPSLGSVGKDKIRENTEKFASAKATSVALSVVVVVQHKVFAQ